jgi:hypothetical protein
MARDHSSHPALIPKILHAALAVALVVLWATPAKANPIIPPVAVIWPAAWVLLIPVILIEAAVAVPTLGLRYGAGLRMSGAANLISTLFGVPLATCAIPYDWFAGRSFLAACVILFAPLFAVSVASEALIARRFLEDSRRRLAWRWAVAANGLTYVLILAALASLETVHRSDDRNHVGPSLTGSYAPTRPTPTG